jgi:hypothetical protein
MVGSPERKIARLSERNRALRPQPSLFMSSEIKTESFCKSLHIIFPTPKKDPGMKQGRKISSEKQNSLAISLCT